MSAMNVRDANQVLRSSARELSSGDIVLGTKNLAGSLVPDEYDQIVLTYVASGNGTGEIETATYKLDGNTVATLTMSYDLQDRLVDVVRS